MSIRTPERVPQIPHHLSLPDFKGGLRWARKNWKPVGSISLAVAALGSGVLLWIAHDRGPQTSATPTKVSDTFNPPKDESGIALVPLATSTPEVTPKPPATSTPEAKADVLCGILPPEYCSQAERVYYESNGKSYLYIGINLPQGNPVPVSAAVNGHFNISNESGSFYGKGVNVRTAAGENFDLRGNIDTSKWGKLVDIGEVSVGTVLGYAQASPNKSLGKYDLVFTITRANPTRTGPEVVEEKLKDLFPAAFQGDSQTYSSTQPSRSVGTVYLGKEEAPK